MDSMKIKSGFMRGIVSRFFSKKIKKVTGYDVSVDIQNLEIVNGEEHARIHLELDGLLSRQDLEAILTKMGL